MRIAVILILPLMIAICSSDPEVVLTFDAPDTNISGLGYGEGSLWAVDCVTEFAYRINTETGAVEDSWYCANGTKHPTGLTFANNQAYIIMAAGSNNTDPYCYRYSTTGTFQSSFDLDC